MSSSTLFLIILFFVLGFILVPLILWIGGKSIYSKTIISQFEKDIQEKTRIHFEEKNMLLLDLEREKLSKDMINQQIIDLKQRLDKGLIDLDGFRNSNQFILLENERLKSALNSEQEKSQSQKLELEKIGEKFEASFRNLANSILEERSQKFDEHQKTSLKHILDPLQKEMENFKKDFTEKFNKESVELVSLGVHIKHMMDMSHQLSDQANNLSQALRGQVKQQGNWGEAILESILDFAGLQKGVQYFVQESVQNEEGGRSQPDIRVQYPDNRHIIIDSKVSLLHFERLSQAETKEEKDKHMHQLLGSFKAHIDGLSAKKYQDTRENTLDFVMMFIPVEGAFISAMQEDRELWQYAYNKRILLISPTNLIAAMKLVQDFWQKDQTHKNSEDIASKAAGLYEKLVGFVESFEKIGDSLLKAEQSYQQAKNQLSTGRGNLISKAEQMKKINNRKPGKSLPKTLLSNALFEDGLDEEDSQPDNE